MDDDEQNNETQNGDNKYKKSGGPEMNLTRSLAAAMKKWREDLSIVGDDKSEEDGGLGETTIIKTKPTPRRNLSSCTGTKRTKRKDQQR